MKKVLTIAGSDCSGGAGIQADLKTFAAHGVYGMSVITAITAQNTTGVFGVHDIPADMVTAQLDAVFTDISPDAVKIGMVSSTEIIRAIAQKLREYGPKFVVLDPVMVATSGGELLADDAMDALITELMPLATVITPNIPEAELLCGFGIDGKQAMQRAAEAIARGHGCYVLVKGGHLDDCSDDLLYYKGECHWYSAPRVDTQNTHGTGCTLSSAIASRLALGCTVDRAVGKAKEYISGALAYGLDLGRGSGPLNHCFQTMPQPKTLV